MAASDDVTASPAGRVEVISISPGRLRASSRPAGSKLTLQAIVDLAVATIEGCDFAGLFVLKAGRVTTPVNTAPVVAELDALQLDGHEGPCLDCMDQATAVYAEELADDPRWPNFGPQASGAGVRSVLSLCLSVEGTVAGALNLYARFPLAFGAVDRAGASSWPAWPAWPCRWPKPTTRRCAELRTCARR